MTKAADSGWLPANRVAAAFVLATMAASSAGLWLAVRSGGPGIRPLPAPPGAAWCFYGPCVWVA